MKIMKKNLYKYILLPTVVIIAALTTILFYHRTVSIFLTASDTAIIPEDPLHEAVILYWQGKKDDAKKLLLRLSRDDKYAARAYINYGLLMEREGDFDEAESSYRNALKQKDNTALFFLINLASRSGNPLQKRLLTTAENIASPESSFRVEYRRAEECLIRGDTECALDRLDNAVKGGMPLGSLVYYDPLFKPLHENPRFRAIMIAARKNTVKNGTLADSLAIIEADFFKESPEGMSRDLITIFNLPLMESEKAEEEILKLLDTRLNSRDRAIALYWLARINAKRQNYSEARRFLSEFKTQIRSAGKDPTGFSPLIRKIEDDLLANDPLLKNIR